MYCAASALLVRILPAPLAAERSRAEVWEERPVQWVRDSNDGINQVIDIVVSQESAEEQARQP